MGERKLSQDPKKYTYNSILMFHENADMDYYTNYVKNVLNVDDFIALTLEGDKLTELDQLVYCGGDTKTNNLIVFLKDLYNNLDTFCLIKFRNEECIDEIHIVDDTFNAVNLFLHSLERSCPKGIVIIKKIIEFCNNVCIRLYTRNHRKRHSYIINGKNKVFGEVMEEIESDT